MSTRNKRRRRLHFAINTPYTQGEFPGHSDSRMQAAMIGFRTYPLKNKCRKCKTGTHAFVVSGQCVTCTHLHNQRIAHERQDPTLTLIHHTDMPAKYRGNPKAEQWFRWTRQRLTEDRACNGWIWFIR